MLSKAGIKYHFLSLWYDSIWDWTLVFQTIGEHSTHQANGLVVINYFYLLPAHSLLSWWFSEEMWLKRRVPFLELTMCALFKAILKFCWYWKILNYLFCKIFSCIMPLHIIFLVSVFLCTGTSIFVGYLMPKLFF